MNKSRLVKKDEVPQQYKEPFKVRAVPQKTMREPVSSSNTKKYEEPRTAFNALFPTQNDAQTILLSQDSL